MSKEMDNLLTRMDELLMEARDKGYSFIFDAIDDEDMNISMTLYSGDPTFGIDIIEWNYTDED